MCFFKVSQLRFLEYQSVWKLYLKGKCLFLHFVFSGKCQRTVGWNKGYTNSCFWCVCSSQTWGMSVPSFLQLLQCDMNSRPSFLQECCSCLGYFFCTSFRGTNTRLVCLVLFSSHVAHTWVDWSSYSTDWEPLVSRYSASSLAEALLEGAMLQWVYFVWFYLEVEVVGTVCYLADCLFWAQVLQVMLVDISSPNLPAMSHLAQLMPAKCKPWKCKIKPFLIIRQHLSLPGLPSFFFWVPLMEHH